MIQKENIKLSESIITAKEDENIGENTHYCKMTNRKHNKFRKTYEMTVSFKLNIADFLSLLKVGLSPSKKVCFICFNQRPLKMMKNAFCFLLKALFVLKIFKFLF